MKDLIMVFFRGHGRSIFPDERSISPDTTDTGIWREMASVWEWILPLETKWVSFLKLMCQIWLSIFFWFFLSLNEFKPSLQYIHDRHKQCISFALLKQLFVGRYMQKSAGLNKSGSHAARKRTSQLKTLLHRWQLTVTLPKQLLDNLSITRWAAMFLQFPIISVQQLMVGFSWSQSLFRHRFKCISCLWSALNEGISTLTHTHKVIQNLSVLWLCYTVSVIHAVHRGKTA